jgi:hypothetical protein
MSVGFCSERHGESAASRPWLLFPSSLLIESQNLPSWAFPRTRVITTLVQFAFPPISLGPLSSLSEADGGFESREVASEIIERK